MSQQKLLAKVVRTLDDLKIPYMVTGSIVSSLQGEPRATHDIDFVVSIHKHHVDKLADKFQMPDFYLDKDAILEAINSAGMFNLLELESGDKVDFWLLTDDPFDQSRFNRRIRESLNGDHVYVSSPEDTILMKLKWAKMSGGSEKQFKDCLRIYEVQHSVLDHNYLKTWAARLQVTDLLQRIFDEAAVSNST